MALDVKQYLEELYKAAGVSDDNVKQAVSAFFGNEAVSKRLNDDVLRQQDYSRNMDSLKADKQKTADYYQQLVTWKATAEAELEAERAGNGNGNGNGHREVIQPVQTDFIAKKDMEAELKRREALTISLMKDVGYLASAHATEFKEPLDMDALEKIAIDKNLPVRQAYAEMVRERRSAIDTEKRKAEIEAAKAEGAREFASKHKIPVDTRPREDYSPLLEADRKKQVGVETYVPNSGRLSFEERRQLRENFADSWNSAQTNTSGT